MRHPGGTSTAQLRWEGAARLLLPSARLRIAGNQISARLAAGPWRQYGSASGIALDVGRELRTHPFLLDDTAASDRARRVVLTSVARPTDLRAYAGSERHGLATDLLLGTRRLAITSVVEDGALVADTFTLVTALPERWALRFGTELVTVRATTTYCAR